MSTQTCLSKNTGSRRVRTTALIAGIIALGLLPVLALEGAPCDREVGRTEYECQSGGHVLRFAPEGYSVIAPTHTLHVRFVEAADTSPRTEDPAPTSGLLPSLERVHYRSLWDGISVAYDAPNSGIVRSTFTLEVGADPGRIRLAYDRPITIEPGGTLRIDLPQGRFHESAPVAWQEIDGRRVDVVVSFTRLGPREVGFSLGDRDLGSPVVIDPVTTWNTFLGGEGDDYGDAIHVAPDGTLVVVGSSDGTWGTPILPFSGNYDAFVAKLDAAGNLLWNTFLGGTFDDFGHGLAVDASGSIFVAGLAEGTWPIAGTPVNPYVDVDAYVARLSSNGALVWRTYTSGNGAETAADVAIAPNGDVLVVGSSDEAWGAPLHGHAGGANDAWVMRLSSSGNRIWNTFLGGSGDDTGESVVVDEGGSISIAGTSDAPWGSAVRLYTGQTDAFVARLTATGSASWNTFLGGTGNDLGSCLELDAAGSLVIVGASTATWENPVRGFTSSPGDGFVAELASTNGVLLWNTFLGGSGDDASSAVVSDAFGNLFVVGSSSGAWGAPVQGHSGGNSDASVARLDPDGNLLVHTFLGGNESDRGAALVLDSASSVLALGRSNDTWGTPIRPYTPFPGNNYDAFVASVDIAPPVTLAFAYDFPATSPTNADSLSFLVSFSEEVIGVGPSSFAVTGTTGGVVEVNPLGGGEYLVTVGGGDLADLDGFVGLDFAPGVSIADLAGNPLAPVEPAVDDLYEVDNTVPDVAFDQVPPDPSGSSGALFVFSSGDPTAAFEIEVDGGGYFPATSPFDLLGLLDGIHTFAVRATDAAGNSGTVQHTWEVDLTAPAVDSILRAGPNPTSAPFVDFSVTFTEPVTGVQPSNFSLSTTGVTGAVVTEVVGTGTEYTVTVDTGTDFGTIRLDLTSVGSIEDVVGNPLAGVYTSGEFYTIVAPDPQFLRGDANTDTALNIADAIFVLSHLFTQGPAPSCFDTADANDDGSLNIADPINVLDYLFSQGSPFPDPFGACGIDPTPDGLDCASYDFCQP